MGSASAITGFAIARIVWWETEEFYVPKLATRFGFLFFSWAVLG